MPFFYNTKLYLLLTLQTFNLLIQMNLGSQSISNESQSFNDYRYQKALKQISKLISVNRQIKIQSQKIKAQYEELSLKNQQLLQMNSNFSQEIQHLTHELQTLSINHAQLQDFCKKKEFEQKQLLQSNELESLQKLQLEKKYSEEIQELQGRFREQMNEMMMEIHSRDSKIRDLQNRLEQIDQLQAQNNKLHQSYQQVLRDNQQLNKKTEELSQEIINMSTKVKEESNQDLVNKLRINQEWIKSLNEENYNLKQKVLEEEYKKQREKCNQTILQNLRNTDSLANFPSGSANQLIIREYIKQVQKKLKKMEEEKLKVEAKYTKLKTKYHELEAKSTNFEREVNLLTVKINGYEQLTVRQQKQIEKMIEEYHREMDKVVKKKKKISSTQNLQQPCQSDTTNNREKQLKTMIQNLETEISQNQAQAHQKDKLIKFLEYKIQALEAQRLELQKANFELQEELSSYQNMDLSKTSKNYNKGETMLKTHSITKNGGKIFNINGKKYETKLLKNSSDSHTKEQEDIKNGLNLGKIFGEKKAVFPSGQIEYLSSQRSYGNQQQSMTAQRA